MKIHKGSSGLLLLIFLLPFQNCGEFKSTFDRFPINGGNDQSLVDYINNHEENESKIPPLPIPELIQYSKQTGCLNKPSKGNACIFWKNPVAVSIRETGDVLPSAITSTTNMDTFQTYAVTIDGFNESGTLQNDSFSIYADLEGAQYENGAFKGRYTPTASVSTSDSKNFLVKSSSQDTNHHLEQLSAWYYLNLQVKYMDRYAGGFYAKNKAMPVIAYTKYVTTTEKNVNDNARFIGATMNNSEEKTGVVLMGETKNGNTLGLSSEIYLHEMGHANLYIAGNIDSLPSGVEDKNTYCDNPKTSSKYDNKCCLTTQGCSGAINEGQADYHAILMYPENPAIGESYLNSAQGIVECELTRNSSQHETLTAKDTFDACNSSWLKGEVHIMGRIYAAIWYFSRQSIHKHGLDVFEFDQLFTEHLTRLHQGDDFKSAYEAIEEIDQSDFDGKFSPILKEQFEKHGILL